MTRRTAHGFDTTRNRHIDIAHKNCAGGLIDGAEPEAQSRLTVIPGNSLRNTSRQSSHPCHVAVVFASLVRAPEDHFIDGACIDCSPQSLQQSPMRLNHRRECWTVPAKSTDWRAYSAYDGDLPHAYSSSSTARRAAWKVSSESLSSASLR